MATKAKTKASRADQRKSNAGFEPGEEPADDFFIRGRARSRKTMI